MEKPQKILIAGAGLVGSLAAIAFKKRGHDVTLLEKRSDMRLDENAGGKSINLILTRKGIEPLKRLGLLDTVLTITTPVYGRMMHDQKGELTYQPYGKDDNEKNFSVSRAKLNMLMMDEAEKAGVKISFEDGIESINFQAKSADFDRSKNLQFDKFIGADGAGSLARAALLKELKDRGHEEIIPLGSSYKELLMPAKSDGSYAMDEKALHIWPRGHHFLMALPNLDGSFTMTVYMPDEWFNDFTSKEKIENYFKEFYPDAIELMPNYIEEFLENPHGFLGSLEMNQWVLDDSFVLVGDAAHAICPFFGQGMNCGFSDIEYLLNQLDENTDDWSLVLKNYQAHQKPNGDAIRDMSLENFKEMSETVADEKFIFRKQVERVIENAMPELYRSRYAQVVYTLTPYHIAFENGEKQKAILDQLCIGLSRPEDVDLDLARSLMISGDN